MQLPNRPECCAFDYAPPAAIWVPSSKDAAGIGPFIVDPPSTVSSLAVTNVDTSEPRYTER